MKATTRTLTALVTTTAAALGLAACTPALTACTVRHHYAIVMFQNGGAVVGKAFVTQFRLNVKYSPSWVEHWIMDTRIPLEPARGNRLSVAVKTYQVGHAESCWVDKVQAH
jgi:hypothetical protein